MSDFYKKYEGSVHTTYSELGKENQEDPDVWGNVEYKGRRFNIYTDPEFAREIFTDEIQKNHPDKNQPLTIADFGGNEGFLVNLLAQQLEESGYEVTPFNFDINEKALNSGSLKYEKVRAIKSDLLALPLPNESIDSGVVRFVLQYMGREQHPVFLKELSRVMKTGGDASILLPGKFSADEQKNYHQFYFQAAAAMIGENLETVKLNRSMPSGQEIAEVAEKFDFNVTESRDFTDEVQMWISPQSFASRFSMSPERLQDVTKVFENWKLKGEIEFSPEPGILRAKGPLCLVRFKKQL